MDLSMMFHSLFWGIFDQPQALIQIQLFNFPKPA